MKRFSLAMFSLAGAFMALALWAGILGPFPLLTWNDQITWWPGVLLAFPAALFIETVLQNHATSYTWVYRLAGAPVVLALAGLGALSAMVASVLRWNSNLSEGLAAVEMVAISLPCLFLAGASSRPEPKPPLSGLPQQAMRPPAHKIEGDPISLQFTRPANTRWETSTQIEPVKVMLRIDPHELAAVKSRAHDMPHTSPESYNVITAEVADVADQLRSLAIERYMSRFDEVDLVARFVTHGLAPMQSNGDDRPLYPLEALGAPNPGPTARTILAATLLLALGYRVEYLQHQDRLALKVGYFDQLPELHLRLDNTHPAVFVELKPDGACVGDAPLDVIGGLWCNRPAQLLRAEKPKDQVTDLIVQ